MKTTYYTFIVWDESAIASGSDSAASGSRQCAMIRQPPESVRCTGGGKVIELDAWCAEGEVPPELEEPEWGPEAPEEAEPVQSRPRRNHHWLRSLWSWLTQGSPDG